MKERLEAAGARARVAEGFDAARSGPALLLEVMGRFARSRSMAVLAEWARHPDARLTGGGAASLGDLDRYRNAHLVARLPAVLPGEQAEKEQDRLRWAKVTALVERAQSYIPEDAGRRMPWPVRAAQLAEVLGRVYGTQELDRVADHRLIEALSAVAASLDEVVELDAATTPVAGVPEVTFAQAVDLTLSRLRGTGLPEPGGFAAVELTGFPGAGAGRCAVRDSDGCERGTAARGRWSGCVFARRAAGGIGAARCTAAVCAGRVADECGRQMPGARGDAGVSAGGDGGAAAAEPVAFGGR